MVLGLTSFLVQAWMWFASLFDNMMVGLDNAAGYVDELTAVYLQTNSTDVDSKFIQEEPKLIRWGCLRWTQGRKKPVVPARNDYIASENYFLKLDVGPLQGHWLLDRAPGSLLTAEESRSLLVHGFPLVGAYAVDKIDDKNVTLRPSCLIDSADFPEDWDIVSLDALPVGMRNMLKRHPRQHSLPLNADGIPLKDSPNKDRIIAVAQEAFFRAEDGEYVAVVKIEQGNWTNGLQTFLQSKVVELNEAGRFVIILILTVSGIVQIGGAAGDDDAGQWEEAPADN